MELKRFLIMLFTLCLALFLRAGLAENIEFAKTLILIDEYEFQAEVARTPAQRANGLMYRTKLGSEQAMIFVFEDSKKRSFWMKNTKVYLDILYFDKTGSLVEIKNNIPPCRQKKCPTYPSKSSQVRFVVEVQGGLAKKINLQIGMRLKGCGFL